MTAVDPSILSQQCADCPPPLGGPFDWFVSSVVVAGFALLTLAGGIYVLNRTRPALRRVSPTRVGGSAVLLGGLASGFILEDLGHDLPVFFEVSAAVASMAVFAATLPIIVGVGLLGEIRQVIVGAVVAGIVWGGTWLSVIAVNPSLTSVTVVQATPTLYVVLGYPLGLALAIDDPEQRIRAMAAVGTLMGGCVVLFASMFVPLSGGPSVVVLPGLAILVAGLSLLSVPAVAAGAGVQGPALSSGTGTVDGHGDRA